MVEVVAALVRRGNQFLICQRPRSKKRGGLWEFPGGKVEPGESHEAALVRECEEELAIHVRVGPLYHATEHIYPDISIRLSLYEAIIEQGEPQAREHEALRWIGTAHLGLYTFCPADEDIIALLRRRG